MHPQSYPSSPNCLENFRVLMLSRWWKYQNAEKKTEFPKISIKMKDCKTFYEKASYLKEIIQPARTHSPRDIISLRLWNKHFLTGIYKNIQTFTFKLL